MVVLPAVCKNCGTIFSSGFAVENATVTMVGSESGPCPQCGAMGRIPNGTFKIIENIIEVLSAPQRTIDELNKLSVTLEIAKKEKYSSEELKNKIEEDVPDMSAVMDLLPKTREEKRSDIKFLITTIIAVIGIINTLTITNSSVNIQEDIQPEQVINHIYNIENLNSHVIIDPSEQLENQSKKKPVRINKVGRNQPCPCGSGLKYKRCHGL